MSNIRVAVRVRPLSQREKDEGGQKIVETGQNVVSIENIKVLGIPDYGDTRSRVRNFTFDYVYDCQKGDEANASQSQVFYDIGTAVLENAIKGFNACVFAYGQTGSGKTHTMMGYPEDVGLIPRICESLFKHVADTEDENVTCRIDLSYYEIYNERVRDLLQPDLLKQNENYSLKIREHPRDGPYVKGLSWHRVNNNEEIQALLEQGNELRVTAETYMHDHSSRSHAIVTVIFTEARLEANRPSEIVCKMNLVDLAGSERADPDSGPGFRKRLTEGANINKSLVTLGYVIKALAERSLLSWNEDDTSSGSSIVSCGTQGSQSGQGSQGSSQIKQRLPYIPYRDSVLTWLLKDSLGGNSKTFMIATISPSSRYYSESISTLRYAQRAKNIINQPHVNEDSNVALIRELRGEIERLHQMLASTPKGSNLVSQPEKDDCELAEKLLESEEKAKLLTQSWMCKWSTTHDIIEETDLSIRGVRNQRSNSLGVMIDSQLPYLVGIDDDILSTGIVIFNLKEGETLVGRSNAEMQQDIVLEGPAIEREHCRFENIQGEVMLIPAPGAMCAVQGLESTQPTKLSQGDYVVLGGNQVFRFNNPAEAAKLRENRQSQGSLNTLGSGYPSYSGLSRASSYNSIISSSDDTSYLSPQQARAYPNYAAQELCRDLEKRYQSEQERLQEARNELQRLRKELAQAEEMRQEHEEEMYALHEQHRADIEEQKRQLEKLALENELTRVNAEQEIQTARESLVREREEFQQKLKDQKQKLLKLAAQQKQQQHHNQQQSEAIQTDPVSRQSVAVSSGMGDWEETTPLNSQQNVLPDLLDSVTDLSSASARLELERLEAAEFSRRMSYQQTEECLAIQQEDAHDAYLMTQEQLEHRLKKIHEIEEDYKQQDKAHLDGIAKQRETVHKLQEREVQLEVYIQENEELISVGSARFHPLRSATSEMTLLDPRMTLLDPTMAQQGLGFGEGPHKTASMYDIETAGDHAEHSDQGSKTNEPKKSTDSGRKRPGEDLESNTSVCNDKDTKLSSVAKDVTRRLYTPPKPKFKYVPKVKEKEASPAPSRRQLRKNDETFNSSLRSAGPVKPKALPGLLNARQQEGSVRKNSNNTVKDLEAKNMPVDKKEKHRKHNTKSDKINGTSEIVSKPKKTGEKDRLMPSRPLGTLSPDRLSIVGPSRHGLSPSRHATSAISLASVPESTNESEDCNSPRQEHSDPKSYIVNKRARKGRSQGDEDFTRCHSAPDSSVMMLAYEQYTEQLEHQAHRDDSETDNIDLMVNEGSDNDLNLCLGNDGSTEIDLECDKPIEISAENEYFEETKGLSVTENATADFGLMHEPELSLKHSRSGEDMNVDGLTIKRPKLDSSADVDICDNHYTSDMSSFSDDSLNSDLSADSLENEHSKSVNSYFSDQPGQPLLTYSLTEHFNSGGMAKLDIHHGFKTEGQGNGDVLKCVQLDANQEEVDSVLYAALPIEDNKIDLEEIGEYQTIKEPSVVEATTTNQEVSLVQMEDFEGGAILTKCESNDFINSDFLDNVLDKSVTIDNQNWFGSTVTEMDTKIQGQMDQEGDEFDEDSDKMNNNTVKNGVETCNVMSNVVAEFLAQQMLEVEGTGGNIFPLSRVFHSNKQNEAKMDVQFQEIDDGLNATDVLANVCQQTTEVDRNTHKNVHTPNMEHDDMAEKTASSQSLEYGECPQKNACAVNMELDGCLENDLINSDCFDHILDNFVTIDHQKLVGNIVSKMDTVDKIPEQTELECEEFEDDIDNMNNNNVGIGKIMSNVVAEFLAEQMVQVESVCGNTSPWSRVVYSNEEDKENMDVQYQEIDDDMNANDPQANVHMQTAELDRNTPKNVHSTSMELDDKSEKTSSPLSVEPEEGSEKSACALNVELHDCLKNDLANSDFFDHVLNKSVTIDHQKLVGNTVSKMDTVDKIPEQTELECEEFEDDINNMNNNNVGIGNIMSNVVAEFLAEQMVQVKSVGGNTSPRSRVFHSIEEDKVNMDVQYQEIDDEMNANDPQANVHMQTAELDRNTPKNVHSTSIELDDKSEKTASPLSVEPEEGSEKSACALNVELHDCLKNDLDNSDFFDHVLNKFVKIDHQKLVGNTISEMDTVANIPEHLELEGEEYEHDLHKMNNTHVNVVAEFLAQQMLEVESVVGRICPWSTVVYNNKEDRANIDVQYQESDDGMTANDPQTNVHMQATELERNTQNNVPSPIMEHDDMSEKTSSPQIEEFLESPQKSTFALNVDLDGCLKNTELDQSSQNNYCSQNTEEEKGCMKNDCSVYMSPDEKSQKIVCFLNMEPADNLQKIVSSPNIESTGNFQKNVDTHDMKLNENAENTAPSFSMELYRSPLVETKEVGVGTSSEMLGCYDTDDSLGSDASFADPQKELQMLQEALEKLPPATGPQLSSARRAARQRVMIRQLQQGADSDAGDKASEDTHAKVSARPGSGSRKRRKPKQVDKPKKQSHSTDNYDSSENDNVFTDDSLEGVPNVYQTINGRHDNGHHDKEDNFINGESSVSEMDVNRSYHHRPKKLSGPAQSRPDVTDFVTEPDGRRTVGIQTSDHLRLQSHRSVSTSHGDQSDQEGSFVSSEHGYTMVTSPMSVWTSNEQSQFGYQSDQASSSSGGVGSRCPEMTNHSLAPAARLSMRSMNSISSLASNLQRGPTEMWSTSETDLRPLPHFQDDLAYSVETEGIYPLSDHSPDHSPKHSVYMRAPKEGVFLVPRPDCSTPNHTGHVTISFPESQLQQVNGLESNTPVTFEVTVHESNTDIVYNVDRTEYKTCTINNPNETQQRKIPESILVNVTEKRVCKTDDRKSTTHSEEVVFKCHPESNAMTDTSLVIENSMQLQTTAERETVFKNGEVVSEQTQQRTFKVTDKTNTFVPINNDYEENDERPKNKLQNSGVLGATSYSGVEERDSSEGCVNDKTEHDGAYMDDSNYTSDTSDYGTITSIDGRKGTLSFTSDSDEGECLKPVGSPGISPRASHISKLRFVDAKDPRYQNVPVVNEIEIAEDHVASYLTTPGERICSVQDTSSDFPLAAASSNAINAECVNEILEGSVHDRSIEPMETEHNSYAKVTEGYVTKYDNILPNEQAIQTDLTAEIDQSLPCKDNFSSPNAWNDDSNTSTSSSDYKTPQQSPNVSMNEEVAAQIEDVEIPDLSEVESLQPTPQLIEIGLISTNVPVLNVLPVQVLNIKSNEVRTISVNTDSAPSNIQTILPSKVSQTVGRTTTLGHNDILRSEIEKKIEKLHRHVRSLSDSAISSDFTDENPASISPRGSRVCDHGKRLAEGEIEKLPSNILQTFQLTERVPANENRKFSSSMDNLDPVNNSKYLRSLSESNIDDFTEDMDLSNSSNDSITFVFIGDNNSKEKQLQHEYEETRKNGSASSQSFQDYRNTGEHENEYTDSHRNGLTIENDGYIEDTNGNEVSDDVFSNHSASEEIAAIIEKHQDPQVSIAHANLTVPQSESPHTCTDISDGLVQTRRHISETDDDSAPLRHKFGIDESVLPIPERSMSADNLPKRIKVPPGDLHRSRSTGMLAVGVNAVDESESVIFPPKGTSYTDEDHTDAPSQQTLSDMDVSISDENSDDYDMDSSDDVDDKSSAIVRSIESKSTSLEDFQEEFIIGYKANKDRFHYSQTSTPSSSLDADMDPKSIHDREHIRQVLETVQKFIMPKPTAVDRGTSMESVNQGSETVSIGIQTTTDETNDQDYQHRSLHEQESDHHVLPSLTARYRAQSMDSFGLGRDASSLELTEGQRNWCTLGELMVETTQLLRRINEHLPELDMKSSGYNVDENQTRSILTQWRRMSNQAGISMTDVQTIGVQTDIEPESGKSDKATQDDKPGVAIEMTLVNNDLRISQPEKSETVMTEMIPSSSEENPNEKFLCTIGVQTDSFCGSGFCVQTDHSSPLSVEPCTINELETDNHKNGTSEQDIAVDTITTETALPLAADVKTQTNTDSVDYAAVQSIPGFTVPNTQEIEDLRKEHAKLMENLQKASNKRNERREAIKARKQTPLEFSQPENEAKIELGSNNVKPVVSQAAQGMHEEFNSVQELHKLEKRPKFNGPIKNDPESSLETSKSTEEAEKLLSDDDREISMEDVVRSVEISMEDVVRSDDDEVMSEDNMRSDGEDAEHYILSRKKSVDYNDEILESEKSLGSLTQLSSPGELTKEICDQNVLDNLAGSFVPSTGTSSPDEFVQIKIQFDPKTGLVVENKMIKEEKPSKGKQDVEKRKEQGSTHEHKWALAGDELRSVWERKLEIKQIVDETKEPSDHFKPFNDDESEDLKTASLEDQQPQSFNGENNKVVSRDEDALSVDNDTISDKSPSSPVREDVIVPDVYSSIKEIPRFPELEKIIPAQEPGAKDKNMSEQDPRSLENKEEKPFIRCETSPKLKTQTPRDKQEPVSPELFSKEMTGPFVNEPGLQALDKENPVENDKKGNDGTDGGANPEPIHETVKPSSVTPYETCIPTGDLVDKIEKQPVSKIQNKPGNYSNTAYSNTKDKPVSQRNDEPIYETFKPIYMPNCEQGVLNKDDTDKRTNDKPGIKNPHKPESKPSNIQDSRQPNKSDDKAKDKTNSAPHTKDYSKPFVSKSVAEPYDEFQDVPVSSPKSGAVPVDDSTQIDVVMLETETQTDLPSPVSEEYPDETFVPLEIKEELHILQQERQHIMDLLGLAGLPNSLTVELLEAKLNYCIGQTDMLLDNLEKYIPSDEENDELIGEEQTTKDYIKKYREDLRKSKDDIDECRNQLNNRYPKAISRNRTPLKKTNYFNNNRQAEIESFRLERMREQQDYQRSRHGMPHKGRGSTPLHGNSPAVTPRGSDQSRSSSPSFSPGYMTPRERKEHLVDLRRQLIKDVVEDEKQHSRSCSPVMFKSPPQRHRNASERSQGFSLNARLSISDDSKSIGSSPEQSPYWSKRSVTSPKVPKSSPRRPGSVPSNTLSPQNYYTSPLSLNLEGLEDDESSPYSPYSAYAREHLIPNQRASPVPGVLRGTYELYESPRDHSDSSESQLSPDRGPLDEDKVRRLRPIQASDIKAKIHRQIR